MGNRTLVRDLTSRMWALRHGRVMGQGSMGECMLAGTEACADSEEHVEPPPPPKDRAMHIVGAVGASGLEPRIGR